MKKIIETKRLLIRPFKMSDKKELHKLFGDEETMRMLGIMPPLVHESETKKRLREWCNMEGRFAITLKESSHLLGYIAIFLDSEEGRNDTRELAFALIKEYRHQGYMREAIKGVLSYLKDAGMKYVWACSYKENKESLSLIESMGFIYQNDGVFESLNDKAYETKEYRITLEE